MWFKSETNLATVIELLRVVKDELKKKPYEIKGQVVKARRSLAKAHALFNKEMEATSPINNVICGKLHTRLLVGRALAAKFTP